MPETRGKIKEMTEDDLEGFDLSKVACRSCSGYGNCGYKTYGILNGKVVSICNQRMDELRRQRDEAEAGAGVGAGPDAGSESGAGAASGSESDAGSGASADPGMGSEEANDAETATVTDGSNRLNEAANVSAPEQQTPQIPSVPSAS